MALKGFLKQSTATTITLGKFVDSTDGVTAETALTIAQADVRLSKNDAAFAQVGESTSASHKENGYYSKALNTTDTGTLGLLTVAVQPSGALPVRQDYVILAANVYDSLIGNSDYLQVDTTQISNSNVSTSSAQVGVNVVSSGTAAGVTGYKKNTAVTAFMFYMELTAGGPSTGATVTVQISKDGGAFANVTDGAGVATEVSNGWYQVDLTATEMNADEIALKATATSTNQRNIKIRTQV